MSPSKCNECASTNQDFNTCYCRDLILQTILATLQDVRHSGTGEPTSREPAHDAARCRGDAVSGGIPHPFRSPQSLSRGNDSRQRIQVQHEQVGGFFALAPDVSSLVSHWPLMIVCEGQPNSLESLRLITSDQTVRVKINPSLQVEVK